MSNIPRDENHPGVCQMRSAFAQAFINSFEAAEQHRKQVEASLPQDAENLELAAQEAAKEWSGGK